VENVGLSQVKLSVAMCTYNGAEFVDAQLASIARQTRPPDELVIADDCSLDATVDVIRRFQANSPFEVRLVVNEQTLGSTRNFEKSIGLCSGEIVALSDQDDVWRADKLELIERYLSDHADAGLVFSDADVVDEHLKTLNRRLWSVVRFGEEQKKLVKRGGAFELLCWGDTITGATMAFRSKFKELLLPIPTTSRAGAPAFIIHDGWIGAMISAVADVGFIDDTLIRYRQHSRQQVGVSAVGNPAPSELDTQTTGFQQAIRRRNTYAQMIDVAEAVYERLQEKEDENYAEALEKLELRLRHWKTRASLAPTFMKRVGPILAELVSGRYHKYSRGVSSAGKDLFYPPNQ